MREPRGTDGRRPVAGPPRVQVQVPASLAGEQEGRVRALAEGL